MKSIFAIVLFYISVISLAQGNGNATDPNTSQSTNLDTSIGDESNPEGQEGIDREAFEDHLIVTAIRQFVFLGPHYQRYQEDLRDYIFELWRNPQDTNFTPRANLVFARLYADLIGQETAQEELVDLVRTTLHDRLNTIAQILMLTIDTFTDLTLEQRGYMQDLVRINRQNFNIPFRLTDTNLIRRYFNIVVRHQTLFVQGFQYLEQIRHWYITTEINTYLNRRLWVAMRTNEVDPDNIDPIEFQMLFEGWYLQIRPEPNRPRSPIFWENNNITERDLPSPRTPILSRPGSPKE